MSDEKVGYRKPPKASRIRKGEVRNPYGRAGKQKSTKPVADNSAAAILDRIDAEQIEVQGQKMTRRECELRVQNAKALKGDTRASAYLEALRSKARSNQPKQAGGVLVVPGTAPLHEWSVAAALQQAKFRTKSESTLADDDEET